MFSRLRISRRNKGRRDTPISKLTSPAIVVVGKDNNLLGDWGLAPLHG